MIVTWRTRDGRERDVQAMEDLHIRHTIAMLERKYGAFTFLFPERALRAHRALRAEIKRRDEF